MSLFKLAVLASLLCLTACSKTDDGTYTLYRNSTLEPSMRIHFATFDAADGENYNQENCNLTKDLIDKTNNNITRFWCEKGLYRK